MEINISPGQIRLREIVGDTYPLYKSKLEEYKKRGEFKKIDYYDLCVPLRNRFASDPIITKDKITGQNFDSLNFSSQYLRWQYKNAIKIHEIKGRTPATFKLDNYHSDEKGFFYEGDTYWKTTTTYFCLFRLHEGIKAPTLGEWDVSYYESEGILESGSSGHHRTLGHVLYGKASMETFNHRIIEYEPDSELNRIIIRLERFFKELAETPEFKKCQRSHASIYFSLENRNEYTINEHTINAIKSFGREVTKEEWSLIKKIIKYCLETKNHACKFIYNKSVVIEDLQLFLSQIRDIYGLSRFGICKKKIQNQLPAYRKNVTHLERILLGLKDFD